LPTPASSQLRERWRSSRHAGRLLEKARAWVFRRKFLYWGMFAATGGIVAELIIDIWRATDGAGARTLSAIWNEKPDWSGDDLVERLVDVVPALYAWAGVSIRQGGELAVRAVRSEAALLVVPEVLASTLGFILVAVICYGLSVDARARMARLFARSWFTILQSTGTSPRGRAIGGDALGSEQATRAGGAGQETNGREGSLQ
jgi:hypothetical protein